MDSNTAVEKTSQELTDEEKLTIYGQCHTLAQRLLDRKVVLVWASPRIQAVIEGVEFTPPTAQTPSERAPKAKPPKPKVDLAEKSRARFEAWYRGLGFTTVTVPKPEVSNREFRRRARLGHALFYRPPSSLVSYEALMIAVRQGGHWSVTDQADRAKVGWEPTVEGYWFWVEVLAPCPRVGTSWNDLTASIRLLSLEEYVIVWHATKAETGTMLDSSTWCWLRTRFGQGALAASERAGEVRVLRCDAVSLAIPGSSGGGRLAEVVSAT